MSHVVNFKGANLSFFGHRCKSNLAGIVFVLGVCHALAPEPADAQIYRWVDRGGEEHFVMDLREVPPAFREEAKRRAAIAHSRISIVGQPDKSSPPRSKMRSSEFGRRRQPPSPSIEVRPEGKPQLWWRDKWALAQMHVRQAKSNVERIRTKPISPEAMNYNANDFGRRRWERNKSRRDHLRTQAQFLANAEEALSEAEEAKAKFAERARRAGVPPGWIRD